MNADAQLQGLAVSLMDGLPMQTFFNLLGRGYKLVLSGHQFGAVMAHALACHLLLQLQHEILTAQEMGINLSALTMTLDKVGVWMCGVSWCVTRLCGLAPEWRAGAGVVQHSVRRPDQGVHGAH